MYGASRKSAHAANARPNQYAGLSSPGYVPGAFRASANQSSDHSQNAGVTGILSPPPTHAQQKEVWESWQEEEQQPVEAQRETAKAPEKPSLNFTCPILAGSGPTKCPWGPKGECGGFSDIDRVREHIVREHGTVCPDCGRCFRASHAWKSHRQYHQKHGRCEDGEVNKRRPKNPLWQTSDVLDNFHQRQVSSDKSSASQVARWKRFYKMLYPERDDVATPSPFYVPAPTYNASPSSAATISATFSNSGSQETPGYGMFDDETLFDIQDLPRESDLLGFDVEMVDEANDCYVNPMPSTLRQSPRQGSGIPVAGAGMRSLQSASTSVNIGYKPLRPSGTQMSTQTVMHSMSTSVDDAHHVPRTPAGSMLAPSPRDQRQQIHSGNWVNEPSSSEVSYLAHSQPHLVDDSQSLMDVQMHDQQTMQMLESNAVQGASAGSTPAAMLTPQSLVSLPTSQEMILRSQGGNLGGVTSRVAAGREITRMADDFYWQCRGAESEEQLRKVCAQFQAQLRQYGQRMA